MTSSQPVTRARLPDVTIIQGAFASSRAARRLRAPGTSTASLPNSRGIRPSMWETSAGKALGEDGKLVEKGGARLVRRMPDFARRLSRLAARSRYSTREQRCILVIEKK
jgi:hypothetical protein